MSTFRIWQSVMSQVCLKRTAPGINKRIPQLKFAARAVTFQVDFIELWFVVNQKTSRRGTRSSSGATSTKNLALVRAVKETRKGERMKES